jgi:UrcA family protein
MAFTPPWLHWTGLHGKRVDRRRILSTSGGTTGFTAFITQPSGALHMKIITITALALLSSFAWNGAHADSDKVLTTTVKYGDLDLENREGLATLYRRIEQASRTVCAPLDPYDSVRRLELARPYKACLTKALSEAVVTIGKPQFTEYAINRSGLPGVRLASR